MLLFTFLFLIQTLVALPTQSEPSYDYSLIMVVAGDNYSGDDVEIVRVNGPYNGTHPRRYPLEREGMVGTFTNGNALVCGGYYPYEKDCYAYDFNERDWLPKGSMRQSRGFASAVMLNDSHWWVTGGFGTGRLKSTELYSAGYNNFSSFLNLPVGTDHHIILKIDETHFFLCCGIFMYETSYILDLETEIWTEVPESQYDHYNGHAGTEYPLSFSLA